jgi:thioredoxin 1
MELKSIINKNEVVVVDFSAPDWCIPCQRLAPHYETASMKRPNVVFVQIDIDAADEEITKEYNIMSVPTVYAFKNGERTTIKGRTVLKLLGEIDGL